jgi:hypothetical protein
MNEKVTHGHFYFAETGHFNFAATQESCIMNIMERPSGFADVAFFPKPQFAVLWDKKSLNVTVPVMNERHWHIGVSQDLQRSQDIHRIRNDLSMPQVVADEHRRGRKHRLDHIPKHYDADDVVAITIKGRKTGVVSCDEFTFQ